MNHGSDSVFPALLAQDCRPILKAMTDSELNQESGHGRARHDE